MPVYFACPHCFHSVRADRLQTRRTWLCARCKRKADVREDLRWEVRARPRLPRWAAWAAVALALALAAAAVWFRASLAHLLKGGAP